MDLNLIDPELCLSRVSLIAGQRDPRLRHKSPRWMDSLLVAGDVCATVYGVLALQIESVVLYEYVD